MDLNSLSTRTGFIPAMKVRGVHTGKCGWVEPHCYDTPAKLAAAVQRRVGGGYGQPEQPYEVVATHFVPLPLQRLPAVGTEIIAYAKVVGAVGLPQRQALLLWYNQQPKPVPGNAGQLHQAIMAVYVGRYGSYDADSLCVLRCFLQTAREKTALLSDNPLDYWVTHGFIFRKTTTEHSFFN